MYIFKISKKRGRLNTTGVGIFTYVIVSPKYVSIIGSLGSLDPTCLKYATNNVMFISPLNWPICTKMELFANNSEVLYNPCLL